MKIQILLICFLGVCLENVLVTGLMFDIDDPIKGTSMSLLNNFNNQIYPSGLLVILDG